MPDQFSRTRILLGDAAMRTLATSRVAVFGVGGVGGYAVEALVRSGIGAIDLVDGDVVDLTNLNRQIIAVHSSIGKPKVQVAAERIRDIAPECIVRTHECFYLPATASCFDLTAYDYVLDAVDTVTAKLLLIERTQAAGVPIISCMGAGNKLDPARFRVADIYDTSVDKLAKVMRKECRKRGIRNLKVVYSDEPPAGEGGRPPGSVAFVPAVAGLVMAGQVVRDLTQLKGE